MSNNPKFKRTKRHVGRKRKYLNVDDARDYVIKIKQLEGLTKASLANYEKVFNDFDRYFGEETPINSLTVDDARGFVNWQLNEKTQFLKSKHRKEKKKGVSVNSANTYIRYAKTIFTTLQEEGRADENIFENINLIKQKSKRIETLTLEEIRKLFRALDKTRFVDFQSYVLLHVLLDSFGRIEETLSVKKSDVDFKHCTITFNNTKNGRFRILPLTKKTLKLIAELIEESEDFHSEYLFVSTHGTRLRPDTFRKRLREAVQRAGINKRIHPHLFRHSSSRMFLEESNGNIRVLQKILDHSDVSTTSRYAHVLDKTIEEQHRQFSPINLLTERRKSFKRKNI